MARRDSRVRPFSVAVIVALISVFALSCARPAAAAGRRANLGDFCAPGNSRHLRDALKARSDAGKNVVLAVSNGGDGAPFTEMTRWFVRDVERTGTPYLFMAMDEEQCDHIEDTIQEGLAWDPPEGWAGPDPRSSSKGFRRHRHRHRRRALLLSHSNDDNDTSNSSSGDTLVVEEGTDDHLDDAAVAVAAGGGRPSHGSPHPGSRLGATSRRSLLQQNSQNDATAGKHHVAREWHRSPGAEEPRCGYCSLRYKNMVRDAMMLQRLRYKLLFDTIHLGHNGLISDLDIVFHENPFPYLDQLKKHAMSGWLEGMPLKANGGLFFARGDKDPKTGKNRLLARWVLGEFLRRQHEVFRDITVGWRKIGEGVRPPMPMEEVRQRFSDIPMVIQHVTDDQDMIRDTMESATGAGIVEYQAYRGMRMRISKDERGDDADTQRIGEEANLSPARDKIQHDDPDGWPDFSNTAGKTLRCYEVTRGASPWVALTVPGTGVTETIVRAPDWLLRGPEHQCDHVGDMNLRPAAVVHCVGKKVECLYPAKFRPGAIPEGRPDHHIDNGGRRRRLGEILNRAVRRGVRGLVRRMGGEGGGSGGADDDGFVLVKPWEWIVANLAVDSGGGGGGGNGD